MALSKQQGLQILNESPARVYNVLQELRACYNRCLYADVRLLQREAQIKIEKCAVDFRYASIQTSSLAERLGSIWCRDCILFFENVDKSRDPCKVLSKVIPQASQIGKWMRDVAGRFHECQELAKRDKTRHQERAREAVKDCEREQDCASDLLRRRESELEGAREEADAWRIAAISTVVIPIVNIITLASYASKEGDVVNARRKQERAEEEASDARRSFDQARYNMSRTEVAAGHVADLIQHLGQVEAICEAQAAFWSYQADKFGTFSSNVESAQEFIELGIGDESVEELTDWLKERKVQLENYHLVMKGVNSSSSFPTSLSPTPLPTITLNALNI